MFCFLHKGYMKNNFELLKVFDCQDMPDDVRNAFFACSCAGNDVYVNWGIAANILDPDDEYDMQIKKVDDWLISNGAEGPIDGRPYGEEVLIKHWW